MTNEETSLKSVNILLVEDNPADVRLTMEAFKDAKVNNNFYVVDNGEDVIAFLKQEGKYSNMPRADLILLDLNIPKKDGREVLEEIKKEPELKKIPVIILTTSKAEEDIIRTYNLHANCYIHKPVDLNEFIKIVKSIENFWLTIVKLPST